MFPNFHLNEKQQPFKFIKSKKNENYKGDILSFLKNSKHENSIMIQQSLNNENQNPNEDIQN